VTNFPSIKKLPVSELIPYARNARTHSDAQVAQIAASIKEFGWTNPVLIDGERGIIAGHGRVLAARKLGMEEVPCIELAHLTEAQKRAYILADNQLAANAGWDMELLKIELGDLDEAGFDLSLIGFDEGFLAGLLEDLPEGLTDPDETPEAPEQPVTQPGDVWICGKHRVMCGDSTVITDVERLMAGAKARLLHADPPYGMGKESDGVANDNLYGDDLDKFQMEWWATVRPFLEDNASAYIWGNAPDLWRLWYVGGLLQSEKLELRNEIVWDKGSVRGMASEGFTQYPTASERCLFFQIGDQFLGNINAEDFPESWEPLRAYLEGEAKAAGVNQAEVKRVCGVSMYSHWFTRSQFQLIPEKHYRALAEAFPGYFKRDWFELKAEWDLVAARSYFDNSHETMRDVWEYPIVTGEDRQGHATPKPVAMMERILKSSLPVGGLVVEPFGGSGSTLMGAEKSGRVCYTMELKPEYCDVIITRWQNFTGQEATLESTGRTYAETRQSAV